jgi:diguanylate cyclase (GGDEF)-like protein
MQEQPAVSGSARSRRSIVRLFVRRILLIVALTLSLGGAAIFSLSTLAQEAETAVELHLPRMTVAYRLSVDAVAIADLSIGLGTVATESERRTIEDRIVSRAAIMDRNIQQLEAMTPGQVVLAPMRRTRDDLMDGMRALSALVQDEILLRRSGGTAPQLEVLAGRKRNLLMRQQSIAGQLTTVLSAAASEAEHEARHQQAQAGMLARRMLVMLAAGTVLGLLSILWVTHAFRVHLIDRVLGLRAAVVLWRRQGRFEPPPFRPDEIGDLGESLGEMIATIESRTAQLGRLASTDDLTGLSNRRHFMQGASEELRRNARYGRPCSVLLGDVDHFKKINDSRGHAIGDAALRHTAAIWRAGLREMDLSGRLGGEEFVALLPETDADAAVTVAERLRRALESQLIDTDSPFFCTISIGVAEARPGESIDTVLARADTALYDAKHSGRNRVCLAGASVVH